MKRILWLLAMPALAIAQIAPVQLTTPALGYVFDANARALRVLEGIPGAAVMGHEVTVGVALDDIHVAPNRRYALGLVAGEERFYLVKLNGATGAAYRTELVVGAFAFSPGGETVVVAGAEQAEVWTQVAEGAVRFAAMELGSLAGRIDKLAVSDDGNAVLVLSSGGLWLLDSANEPKQLGEGYSDAAFSPMSHKVVAASRLESRIDLIEKAGEDGAWTSIASRAQGILNPVAVALSADGRMIVALNEGASLVAIDRESLQAQQFSLEPVSAGGLWRSHGGAVFQLARSANQDVWIFDGDNPSPRVVMVHRREQ